MSLQLRKLVLYNLTGDTREIDFNIGALNVITGASKTGKSAIIDIVDYCTGRGRCNVPEGIQRYVSWFAILLEDDNSQYFIARRSPSGSATVSADIYVDQGANLLVPSLSSLAKNTTADAIQSMLSRVVGIREHHHVAHPGQTRTPLEANIRHALYLCIQDQNDIDGRSYLFHRQAETYVAIDLRHTLPYFLGAIDENRLLKQAQLDMARRELRILERQLQMIESSDSAEMSAGLTLLAEAVAAGIAPSLNEQVDADEVLNRLRTIVSLDAMELSAGVDDTDNQVDQLRMQRQELRQALGQVQASIREIRSLNEERAFYQVEAKEHQARLSSIGLFRHAHSNGATCPLCESSLATPFPTISQIQESLERMNTHLESAEAEAPRIEAHLITLLGRERELIAVLRTNHRQLNALYRQNDLLEQQFESTLVRARLAGRVEQYLDTVSEAEIDSDTQIRLTEVRSQVESLESELDPDVVFERVETFLGFVSDYMTEYARELDLEYSDHRVRLDIRKLTVVSDTRNGPVTLDRMGSGENWVGYHVVAHLALHRWFRERSAPVPAILLLDQPSQAHFPPDQDLNLSVDVLQDEDKAAVQDLFRLIADVAAKLAPEMQIIVMDHANLDEDWFNASIIEEWRASTDLKLLPKEWLPEDEWGWDYSDEA